MNISLVITFNKYLNKNQPLNTPPPIYFPTLAPLYT